MGFYSVKINVNVFKFFSGQFKSLAHLTPDQKLACSNGVTTDAADESLR